MRLDAVGSRHRADESGFEERAPLVHQTAVSAVVVLRGGSTAEWCENFQPGGQTQSAGQEVGVLILGRSVLLNRRRSV